MIFIQDQSCGPWVGSSWLILATDLRAKKNTKNEGGKEGRQLIHSNLFFEHRWVFQRQEGHRHPSRNFDLECSNLSWDRRDRRGLESVTVTRLRGSAALVRVVPWWDWSLRCSLYFILLRLGNDWGTFSILFNGFSILRSRIMVDFDLSVCDVSNKLLLIWLNIKRVIHPLQLSQCSRGSAPRQRTQASIIPFIRLVLENSLLVYLFICFLIIYVFLILHLNWYLYIA